MNEYTTMLFKIIDKATKKYIEKIDKTLKTNLNTNVAKLLEAKHAVVSRVRC